MFEKLMESQESNSDDSLWGYRKELVVLARTELKFRYLFRLVDLGVLILIGYTGGTAYVISQDSYPEWWHTGIMILMVTVALVGYLFVRRLPAPVKIPCVRDFSVQAPQTPEPEVAADDSSA